MTSLSSATRSGAIPCLTRLVGGVLLLYGTGRGASGQSVPSSLPTRPAIHQVAQVRALSLGEARKGYPVHLHGVVTYHNPTWDGFYLHDATAGIYVIAPHDLRTLPAGHVVDVWGATNSFSLSYSVRASRVRDGGTVPLPPPPTGSQWRLGTAPADGQWMRAEGIVQSAAWDGTSLNLQLRGPAGRFTTAILDGPAARGRELIDARVAVVGVHGLHYDAKDRPIGFDIFVPDWRRLRLLIRAPADPFARSVRTIHDVRNTVPQEVLGHPVRIQGTVTSVDPSGLLFLMDDTGGLEVRGSVPASSRPGDRVDVIGSLSPSRSGPLLTGAIVRRIRHGSAPAPRVLAAVVARGGHDGELIRIQGRVVDRAHQAEEDSLLIQQGPVVFDAYHPGATVRLPFVPDGSLINVTGIGRVERNAVGHAIAFRLMLRAPGDVEVIEEPIWWTWRHLLVPLAGLIVVGITLASWSLLLRRRVRRLEWEAALEKQHQIERKQAEVALQASEARYRRIVETTHEGILMLDAEGRVTFANTRIAELLVTPVEQLVGRPLTEILTEAARTTFQQQFAARRQGESGEYEAELLRSDGSTVWVAVSAAPLCDVDGQFHGSLGMVHDLTARKQAEAELHQVVTRARCILWSATIREAPPDASCDFVWDMTVHDPAAAQHVLPLDQVPGQSYAEAWHRSRHPEDRDSTDRRGIEAIRAGRSGYSQEFRHFDREGQVHWLQEDVTLQAHPDGTWSAVGVCLDITESKRLEGQLTHQALHDALTDLPNRTLFMDRLTHALDQSRRRQEQLAVVFVDLDGFKVINDSLGHQAGDELLKAVGHRLAGCTRGSDTIARLGGDEFSLLLEDVSGIADAVEVVERVMEQLRAPIMLERREVFVSASLGIALAMEDDTPEDLLRHADLALYEAKRQGKDQWAAFDPQLLSTAWDRLDLETDLRHALDRGELRVAYQPIVDLETQRIDEVEALVRWAHPRLGLLAAGEFVPLAEEIGLITEIGEWVMRDACRQIVAWQKRYPAAESIGVAVNVSARQFQQKEFVEKVEQLLDELEMAPGLLKIEITESLMIQDEEQAVAVLGRLRERGIRIALDDFGTGYSALSSLRRLPLDTVKVDRSFVQGMEENPGDAAIIEAIVGFAEVLGLKVTAEGIETEAQRQRVAALGCHRGQGYHFSKPLSSEQLEARLAIPLADHRALD